jgi:uncharacterized alpha-E superfamily protein
VAASKTRGFCGDDAMLSRTADSLFWMARYLERAESTARLLTMGLRMAVLPGSDRRDEWRSILRVTGCEAEFDSDEKVTEADIVRILVLDPENHSSIRSCLALAHANARSVRNALTQEMWESINDGWRKLDSYDEGDARLDLAGIIDWVKMRSSNFRGAAETGFLRNSGHDFLRLGGALERAQITLRLLDVKYYVLLPETEVIGGGRDQYQWTSVLYALSGNRAYHHVCGGTYTPWQITDFLMVNDLFPRSVAYCVQQMEGHLIRLAQSHGGRVACHDTVKELSNHLSTSGGGKIFESGLHESVEFCETLINRLAQEIATAYHF